MSKIDKKQLLATLCDLVQREYDNVREAQEAAQEGATHEETRAEDPKDTRAIEAQYIARGLAERVEELQRAVQALTHLPLVDFKDEMAAALTAVIGASMGEDEKIYFLVPVAGGETITLNGQSVQTLTPQSPLGAQLLGKEIDDDFELELPGRRIYGVIEWLC
jgi:transcription elongation GreA/GreB family factor